MEIRLEALVDSAPLLEQPNRLRARARRDGCLFLRGLIGAGTIGALAKVVEDLCLKMGFSDEHAAVSRLRYLDYDDCDFVALQCAALATREFIEVGDAPALTRVLEILYEGPVRTRRGDLCRIAVPGHPHRSTPPHQDNYYVGGSPEIWTAWLPLTDCPVLLGPLVLLPGSQREGLLPHNTDYQGLAGLEIPSATVWAGGNLKIGDALLFSAMTIHRSLPNRTEDRLRLSVDFRYEPDR